jgi:hypothetical protein
VFYEKVLVNIGVGCGLSSVPRVRGAGITGEASFCAWSCPSPRAPSSCGREEILIFGRQIGRWIRGGRFFEFFLKQLFHAGPFFIAEAVAD